MSFGADLVEIIQELLEKLGVEVSLDTAQAIGSVVIFAIFIITGWIVYHIFERYFVKWAEKTKTKLDDEILRNIKKPIYFFVILAGAYYGLEFLTVLKPYSALFALIFTIAEILLITFIITRVVNVVVVWYSAKSKSLSVHILFVLKKIINAVIFIFAFLFILDVSGFDITGLAVGLGVGGIAIAFALQNVLSDVFSAFSIYFDKPFEIGDFIIVGEHAGIVQKIGMKSTRVKLLQGEELILSNRELTTTSVRNFKKLKKRRIIFHIGVTYGTPSKKLKKIPGMIRKIIDSTELAEPDRIHFKEYGDFSLNFEIVYYMKIGDYAKYMDTQQEINFKIKEAFEKEGIEMAFPTQTIFLNK